MRKIFKLLLVITIGAFNCPQTMFAQTNIFPSAGSAGIGTSMPDTSALLELKSFYKGLLTTRMTKIQRDAISKPATGLLIYQTNAVPGFYYYNGTEWVGSGWSLTGNNGTSVKTNFIGTIDAEPLMFKVNNNKSGYIDYNESKANTGFGYQTLLSNINGHANTANGFQSLYSNVRGYGNTAVGLQTLYLNKDGNYNTAIGHQAMRSNTSGYNNSAVGTSALFYNTSGTYNSAIGLESIQFNITGNYNSSIGYQSLKSNISGNANTGLGTQADVSAENLINATVIGYQAIVDASNKVQVGNTVVTSIGGQVSWSTFSDGRYKTNITENVIGLQFINKLKPITYKIDISKLNEHYSENRKNRDVNDTALVNMQQLSNTASAIVYNGFIAQDVEKAAKSVGFDFSGIDKPQTKNGLYGLRYSDFVIPLVKAVQELSKINDDKDAAIQKQNTKIAELESRLEKLEESLKIKQSAIAANSQ